MGASAEWYRNSKNSELGKLQLLRENWKLVREEQLDEYYGLNYQIPKKRKDKVMKETYLYLSSSETTGNH